MNVRGKLVFEVEGYELEIDHDGQCGGGAIFLRLAGQKHNLPISLRAAPYLCDAMAQAVDVARKIETAVSQYAPATRCAPNLNSTTPDVA